jgi:7,8-dihydropterin-6-yl-methyl-4-(beta-D-ribofuranosyl)aminobenzene 5'-phosphate synthase
MTSHSTSRGRAKPSRLLRGLLVLAVLAVVAVAPGACGESVSLTAPAAEPVAGSVTSASSTVSTPPRSDDASIPASSTTLVHNAPTLTTAAQPPRITVTALYDNRALVAATRADWGFSCVIRGFEQTVLFDTGADGEILMHNMEVLGVDPREIDAVVLSHGHSDHTGGLDALLAANPTVTVHRGSSAVVCPGIVMTAPMGSVGESGVVLETGAGPVLITGCAHPGVVEMTKAASALAGRSAVAVMGGFHLASASVDDVERIIHELTALGVERCGPAHCTGEAATSRMKAAFAAGFIEMGVGAVVTF